MRAGIYLTMVMAMAACSIIVCVFVLDLHHHNSNVPVPDWVRWLLFGHLSRCLGFPVRQCELDNLAACTNHTQRDWKIDVHQLGGCQTTGESVKGSGQFLCKEQNISPNLDRENLADLGREQTRPQNFVFANKPVKYIRGIKQNDKLGVKQNTSADLSCGLVDLERRSRHHNSVNLTDRSVSDGCLVGEPAAADNIQRSGSSDFSQRDVIEDSSSEDAVTDSEKFVNDGRRHSTANVELLLSAILAQLDYITADMHSHSERATVKDEGTIVNQRQHYGKGKGADS